MANLVFPDHVSVSLDHAPSPPQQDIDMTDANTETTTQEAIAQHVMRLRFRLVRHDDTIDRLCDQLEEISLDRMEMIEHYVEALQARVDVAEQKADILQLALEDAWAEIVDLHTR
nr:hypothetical protein [Tanacetum cinerariifolium]